jgi:hypothetical protein
MVSRTASPTSRLSHFAFLENSIRVRDFAYLCGSDDNISVVVVQLKADALAQIGAKKTYAVCVCVRVA